MQTTNGIGVSIENASKAVARKLLQAATQPLAKRWPIESFPPWLGTIHCLRVPRNVRWKVTAGAGGGANVRIIFRLLEPALSLEGNIAECGVFQGSTLIPIGLFVKQRMSSKMVLGFDSFEGLDQTVKFDLELGGDHDYRKAIGGFSDTSYQSLLQRIQQFELGSTVTVARGYFQDTLLKYANHRFSFVHLDCVIYESYKQCLEFFYPRLVKSGVVLLDEYNDPPWPGCTRAVDEFLAAKPEKLVKITSNNQIKYYLCKQ
jgi:Macrocin-O-methyltransferase (TylF)